MTFRSGYVTAPLCGPSRAGFLTGRYQQHLGFWNNGGGIPPNVPLLPGLLHDEGYRTALIGKATTFEGGTRESCIVVWSGLTKPDVATDTIIQSTDFVPTFAELLELKMPTEVKFDGKSFALALRVDHDCGLTFCHFPHSTPASGGLASTWVRVGDWKLIRFYCLNNDRSDLLELYNLKEDLGETNNLAAQMPAKANELNALIDDFLKDTAAVVPIANPAYDPKAKAAPAKKGKQQPAKTAADDLRLRLEEGRG